MLYSKITGGFYDRAIHGDNIPADAIEISRDQHAALLDGQSFGKRIVANSAGLPVLQDPPPPTLADIIRGYIDAVQSHMDSAARDRGYDDIKTAVTYAGEPAVPKFQQEGMAFRAWRSLCWAHCYEVLDAVQAGERARPEVADLIAELPPLVL